MKASTLASCVALLALGTVLPVHAASQPTSLDRFAGEVPIRQVAAQVCANGDSVSVGTSRILVSARLGSPDAVLRDGSWLYSGYTLTVGNTTASEARTLVVRFVNHAVSSLTLADKAAVVALRQLPRHSTSDQFLAVVQRR